MATTSEPLPAFLPTAPQQASDTSSESISANSPAPPGVPSLHPHPQSGPYSYSAPMALPSSLPLPPFPHGNGMLGLTAGMANMPGLGMPHAYSDMPPSMERPSPPWAEAYPLPPVTLMAPFHPSGVMGVPVESVPSNHSALGFIPGPAAYPSQPGQNAVPAPPPGQRLPRPHPFLCHPVIYLSEVPSNVREFDIAGILERQGVPPVAIHLCESPQRQERLWPNAYYEWMNKTGTITFGTLGDAEKAQAILVNHSYLVNHLNIVVSLFSPPICHPLPPAPVAPRLIRPMVFKGDSSQSTYPTEGQIWDTVRGWGSIRHISVFLEVNQNDPSSPGTGDYRWRAKVEFWHEDEAAMFEQGFNRLGGTIAGWQVDIRRDPSYIPFTPMPFQQPPPPSQSQPMPPVTAAVEAPPAEPTTNDSAASADTPKPEPLKEPAADDTNSTPEPKTTAPYSAVLKAPPPSTPTSASDPYKSVQVIQQPPFLPGTGQTLANGTAASIEPVPPLSPPNSANQFVSPWSSHNPNASMPLTPPYPNESLPTDRRTGSYGKRRGNNHKGSSRVGWRHVPGGVVSDDGTVIQHGPGQQIHPSPNQGPGSNSYTGLVDYCNLIVKNLDGDIAGPFLRDSFAPFGQVVNARIMRDECGRSRGYGFVSFLRPHEASQALSSMNGAKLGSGTLYVAYHQPRRNYNKAFTHINAKREGFADRKNTGGFIPRQELEGITLNELAAKNPMAVLNYVNRGGDKFCNRLGIGKCEKNDGEASAGTKVDIICHIHKSAASGESKSRTLQRIKDYVNALGSEDESAMRDLLSYPALIDAMILRQK